MLRASSRDSRKKDMSFRDIHRRHSSVEIIKMPLGGAQRQWTPVYTSLIIPDASLEVELTGCEYFVP